MRLEFGAPVSCTDGAAGELADVVVAPAARRLTHLVVRPPGGVAERLVPVAAASAGAGEGSRISLSLAVAELLAQPSPQQEVFLPVGEFPEAGPTWDVGVEDERPLPSYGAVELGDFAGELATEVEVTFDRVPKGTIELRAASRVESAEREPAGRLDAVIAEGSRITHLVLRRGRLWWRREHALPIEAVARLETDLVVSSLSDREISALPAGG